jgi:hypothetical protein
VWNSDEKESKGKYVKLNISRKIISLSLYLTLNLFSFLLFIIYEVYQRSENIHATESVLLVFEHKHRNDRE